MRSTTVLSFLFASASIAAPILEGVLPVALPDLSTTTSDLDVTKDLNVDSLTGSVPALPVRRGLLSGLDLTKIVPSGLDISTTDLPVDTSSLPLDTSSLPLDTSSLPLDTSSLPLDTSSIPLDPSDLDTSDLPLDTSSVTSAVPVDATTLVPTNLSKRLLDLTATLKSVNTLLNDVLSLTGKVEADLLSLIGHLEIVDVQGTLGDVYNILNAIVSKLHTVLQAEDADVDLSSVQPILTTITTELNSLAAEVQQLIDAGVVGNLIAEVKSVLADAIALVESTSGENL